MILSLQPQVPCAPKHKQGFLPTAYTHLFLSRSRNERSVLESRASNLFLSSEILLLRIIFKSRRSSGGILNVERVGDKLTHSTPLMLQSRVGDNSLNFYVVCLPNGTAVLTKKVDDL